MPRAKFARKPSDLSSGTTPKRADITNTDRHTVLDAILKFNDGQWRDDSRWVLRSAGEQAGVTRFDAEAIATCAGWSNRARVQAARDRYAQAVGA